ncbi:hypothetical protein [Streptomyces sp. 4N124]|uniref:hypothetical protein n=1 Tax=Streptomyces sp. 4N124 TaxID=3457420 RepID=UPI003FCFE7C8
MTIDHAAPNLPDEIDVDAEDFGDNLQVIVDGYRAADYAARFEGLDSDVLFELEYGTAESGSGQSDPDAPQEFVEQLLVVLADWRQALLAGSRADADDYRRCLDAVREAWLQHSFRWVGGPDLPYPFDLPRTEAAR